MSVPVHLVTDLPLKVATRAGDVPGILAKALRGERISYEECVALMRHGDLGSLAAVASAIARRLHPDNVVTFVVDRNINYTNVCVTDCKFCAFYRHEGDPDAYVLTHDEILKKVEELVAVGGTQVLIQGGHHPRLKFDYYLDMCRKIRERFPQVAIHSFSASEIDHFSKAFKIPMRQVMQELRDAGWSSMPGAGAEILVERVRKIIAPRKISWERWIEYMETGAELGLKASATMMFGHVETLEERALHLQRLRDLQDRTRDAGGLGVFRAFICWSYQKENTPLTKAGVEGLGASSHEYLRMLAVSRIFLDNIPNIQASWVTQGHKVGQISLDCGCNDFGGTMMEENVVSAAGTVFHMTPDEAKRLIKAAGRIPAKRDTHYNVLERYE